MKITIDQGALLKELALLQGIIERKATLPILSNVLLNASTEGRLSVIATDLEIGFRSSVPATVSKAGTTTVHARRFHDIVRRLPGGNVGFELKDSFLHIQTERIKYKLATQDPDQFPTLRENKGTPSAQMDSAMLAEQIKRIHFAITSDDPRYSIGGALWELGDAGLRMVATDGHRLSLALRSADKTGDGLEKVVVPRKAMQELLRLAAEHDGDAFLWGAQGSLFAQFGEREMNTSLQEPRFPDYEKVVPRSNDKHVEINRETLKAAIERVAVLSQEHTHLVKLELNGGAMRISATHQQLGDAEEEIPIQYDGEDFAIGFNAQYLMDFLGVAGTERIRLSFGQEMGQGLLAPIHDDDDQREDLYVVMPMALN